MPSNSINLIILSLLKIAKSKRYFFKSFGINSLIYFILYVSRTFLIKNYPFDIVPHPQVIVFPEVRFPPFIIFILPHSHLHFH